MDLEEAHDRLTAIEDELADLKAESKHLDGQFEIIHSWEGISQEIDLAHLRVRDAVGTIEQEWKLRERQHDGE